MPDGPIQQLLRCLRRAAARAESSAATDAQLLEHFVARGDPDAFELLTWRHGRAVWGVCRRLLRDEHEAEDAFQATFLALARKARSIDRGESVGGWLYKVAYRVALEAKARTLKRATREHPVHDVSVAAATPDPGVETEQRELRLAIEDEVNRLPEKYRVPFVLCYFERKSNGEVARELGCPLGTVESRLTRARERLRNRLTRRGFLPTVGLLAAGLSESMAPACVPAPLVVSTVKVAAQVATGQAAGAFSANVAALTEAGLKTMSMSKVSKAAVVLAVSLLISGAGLFTHLAWGEKLREVAKANPKPAAVNPNEAKVATPPRPRAKLPEFATALGYAWAIAPRDGRGYAWSIGWNPPPQPGLPAKAGISAIEETAKDGGLVIFLAHPPSTNQALPDYRPIAFDAARKRYLLTKDCAVGTATANLARYHLDPKTLPAAKVKYLGIEVLTPGGPLAIARQAAERARKAGMEVPGFPEVGKAYDFTLTTTDGKKIRARDLRGKVVLLDCWATWCSPCMALLPEIKELYEKRHADGLEVLGINFDNDAEKAKKTCRLLGMAWPQVIVPNDDATRQLWQEASGIGGLPRVLLIDREGVLRADQAYELDKVVAELLKKPFEKPK